MQLSLEQRVSLRGVFWATKQSPLTVRETATPPERAPAARSDGKKRSATKLSLRGAFCATKQAPPAGRKIAARIFSRLLAFALLAALLAGCLPLNPETDLSLAPLETSGAQAAGALRVEGHLAPRRYVTLALAAPGRAAEVYYEEGQPVEAGAVLVRMASYPDRVADLDSAELDLVCAQQALDDLNENADVALAQAEVTLAQATYERDFAYDRLESFQKRPSQLRVDQAYANMILADNQLELAQEALDRAEKKFNNKKSLVWYFTNRHDFRLQITLLEQNLAEKQRRYNAAKEKYQDLIVPVDPVDLALRRSEYAVAKARWRMARRDRDELRGGPDPEALETARARLSAAQANLAAARKALVAAEIVAPLSGVLVKMDAKPGQWIPAGKPVAQIADLSAWKVVAEEVPEASVPRVTPGEQVRLEIPAAQGFETNGHVEAVDLFYTEEDGDIYYTVEIGLEETDPGGIQRRLRWGMSVQVAFADE